MCLEAPFVGEGQHLVVNARGVAYAQHGDTAVGELLRNPVYGGVALRAHHHLGLAHERFVDGLDQSGGLSRAGRTVDYGHVLGSEHAADGFLLRGIEPGQLRAGCGKLLCHGLWRSVIEQFAKVCQPSRGGRGHPVEGIKHGAVARFVERQLATNGLRAVGELHQRCVVGHGEHHAVAVDIGNGGGEVEILQPGQRGGCRRRRLFLAEEHHGATVFKVVLYLLVGCAEHFHRQLVERVVVASPYLERKPRVAALHLAQQARELGELSERFLLTVVLHLKQQPLLAEQVYG